METIPSSAPEWLKHAHTSPHLLTVVRTLAERERARTAARTASRQRSNSKSQRGPYTPAHILSTLLHKTDHVEHYSVSVGARRDLQPCNRYVDITPYDRTRVVLSARGVERGGSGADGRYLNANWVRELAGGKWWIASQAPLPNTAHTFLSVLLRPVVHPALSRQGKLSRVRTVVQLTQNVEGGMRKAHVYFPDTVGERWVVPPSDEDTARAKQEDPLDLVLERTAYVADAKCTVSTVSVAPRGGQPVVFKHLLYASWPDHGVPTDEDRASLLRFARFVDETNRDTSELADGDSLDPDPPIIVNCSAGVGRTGSFIALSSLLRKYGFLPPPASPLSADEKEWKLTPSPLGPLPEELRGDLIAQEIDMLREQRPGMVQKDGQVAFIYEMLLAAFEERETT